MCGQTQGEVKTTELESKEQSERLEKYKKAEDRISVLERKKSQISNGVLSIECTCDKSVDFDYLGEDFKENLARNIISFLDSEIQSLRACLVSQYMLILQPIFCQITVIFHCSTELKVS